MPIRDDDSQSLDPREFPDPDVEEGAAHLPCGNCLAVIHEDSVRCPRCGHYLTAADARRKPLWLILGVLVCLALVLFGIWLAFDPFPMPIPK